MTKFCGDCHHLNMTEDQQNRLGSMAKGLYHMCNKYKKRVLHGKHRPEIIRVHYCNKDNE